MSNEESLRQVLYAADAPPNVPLAEADSIFNRDDMNKERDFRKKVDALAVTHPGSPPRAMVMVDLPQPVQPHVFKRGNPNSPGEAVPRAVSCGSFT